MSPEENITVPPPLGEQVPQASSGYPKMFYNVNVPVKIVYNTTEEAALGSEWKPVPTL